MGKKVLHLHISYPRRLRSYFQPKSIILGEVFQMVYMIRQMIHSCRFLFKIFLVGNCRFLDIFEHGGHPILKAVRFPSSVSSWPMALTPRSLYALPIS